MIKKRKTRREKIRAGLRRQAVSDGQASQTKDQFGVPTFTFVKREFEQAQIGSIAQAQTIKQKENSSQIEILASTKKDLIKTFILASLIFAAEAMLYWVWK